mmetsp:Transcript_17297/g.56612  ORF Transcript_17297/g.56612 Transcript_17297/m.56612 type:complete len:127 (-) Transcript_17297:1075-1455(-)
MQRVAVFSTQQSVREIVSATCGGALFQQLRFASKKQGGSTQNGRDSRPKHLGLKKWGSERVFPGNIIARQRGTKWHPGANVGLGKDHTIFALVEGTVSFEKDKRRTGKTYINVVPSQGVLRSLQLQ